MDGLKLTKWQNDFEKEATTLKVEYDAFLLPKKFSELIINKCLKT